MRKSYLLCILISQLLYATQLRSQSTEDTLKKYSIDWMHALEQRDSLAIENFLAPEYTLNSVGGSDTTDRTTWINNALNPDRDWREFKYKFGQISIFQDYALVNSITTFKVNPIPFTVSSNVIDHWVFRDGKWQIAGRYIGESSISNTVSLLKGVIWGVCLTLIIFLMIRLIRQRKKKRVAV